MLSDMGMMINRRRVYGGKSLPYDYEVEYLESTGTQYIDTGVFVKGSLEYQIKFFYDNTLLPTTFGGRISKNNGSYLNKTNSSTVMSFAYGSIEYEFDEPNSGIVVSSYLGTEYKFANITKQVPKQSFSTDVPFLLFGSTDFGFRSKIYYFQLFDNGVLLRDLIPVVKNNVGYMYDKVSNTLFSNQGTGSFIVGPRVN